MGVGTSSKPFTTLKIVAAIVLSIAVLILAQVLALLIGQLFTELGVSAAVCNIFAGVLYVAFTFWGAELLCRKLLKTTLAQMRVPKIQIHWLWLISAFAMPALVLGIAVLTGGHWEINPLSAADLSETITGAIFFYGLATGIVEELIFRGIIMRCLERRFNIQIAVIAPSVLFGLLHILGNDLDFISILQLLIAGSIVGILFSLIACESNSIWNSAIVHAVWNMAMIGGIVHIGVESDSGSIFNFVLDNKSFLIGGGDFGIEASVISIFAYLIFIAPALVRIHRKTPIKKAQ